MLCRPEPEAYTTHLAHLIKTGYFAPQLAHCRTQGLGIVDFCSGTGCISLLLYSLLQSTFPALNVRGVDISPRAINLSRENTLHNIARRYMPAPSGPHQTIQFDLGDIFSPAWREQRFSPPEPPASRGGAGAAGGAEGPLCDVLVSNPPYISAAGFARDTARSVRNYEPKLAQVPTAPPRERAVEDGDEDRTEDVFYSRLLEIGEVLRPKIMLFEVGGAAQARRVAGMVRRHGYLDGWSTEIWRDWPDAIPEVDESRSAVVNGKEVPIRGSGHERSVLIYETALRQNAF